MGLKVGIFEISGRRNKISRNTKNSPMLSQMFAAKANKLATIIPTIKEMEIHTNGMAGIVH